MLTFLIFQIIMTLFKALIFLTVFGFCMMNRDLANPLDKDGQDVSEPSHKKEDAEPIDKKIPLASHEEEAISHQMEMKDTISSSNIKKVTNKQQNKQGQVPQKADVSHEKDPYKNSYPKKIRIVSTVKRKLIRIILLNKMIPCMYSQLHSHQAQKLVKVLL